MPPCQARLTFLLFLLTVLSCPVVGLQARDSSAAPPNILLILADDLGYGDLSSYGAPDLQTPHLDALMKKGMRWNEFYANCPVCSPTRAALLSGRYPDFAGVPGVIRTHPSNNWGWLDPATPLLPTLLSQAGYHSALIGKWHLGLESPNLPNDRGFDFFHGFLGDMMDDYYNHRRHGINYMRLNREEIDPEGHATDLFTDWAIDYLEERKRRSDSTPFFLYLAYNAPHTPIQPPAEWLQRVKEREEGIREERARLVALIEHMDHGIGRVMKALEDLGFAQNTLVIFTSDNGGQLSVGARCGNLRGGKQDMYEGGIKVPMCAVWPGKIPAVTTSNRRAMTMDLFTTIAEAAGTSPSVTVNGISLLPELLHQEDRRDERDLIWVRREGGMRYEGQDYYALRRGDWKIVHNTPFDRFELYHLGRDPLESNDLASEEPERYRDLRQALRRHVQKAGEVPWQQPSRADPD